MKRCEIKKGVFWVGAVDWNLKTFHGQTYLVTRGSTYNAYLILDKKKALIDTVYGPYAQEMLEKIRELTPLEEIDYIIANHAETDHSGALPEILKLCPKAKLFGTQKCKEALNRIHHKNMDMEIVKTLSSLELGEKTLSFIEAPMIHWPDSMFTYCREESLLISNDAFGQHYASSERFDDEVDNAVLMDESAKYYANILWPFSSLISKKIEEIRKMDMPISVIAPSHGVIWRTDPMKIINAYVKWANNETAKKAVIVYETMWGSTEKMARMIAEGMIDSGTDVRVFDIAQSNRTEIIKAMLDAKGYAIGSSTHDNSILPTLAGFLHFLKGLRPKNRVGCVFGSYGWSGGAAADIEKIFKETGIDVIQPSISVKYAPDKDEMKRCYDFGRDFARAL